MWDDTVWETWGIRGKKRSLPLSGADMDVMILACGDVAECDSPSWENDDTGWVEKWAVDFGVDFLFFAFFFFFFGLERRKRCLLFGWAKQMLRCLPFEDGKVFERWCENLTEEEDENGGSSESDVEEHVEVERQRKKCYVKMTRLHILLK